MANTIVPARVLHLRSSAGLYGAEHMILNLMPRLTDLGITTELGCLQNQHLDEQAFHDEAVARGLTSHLIECAGKLDLSTAQAIKRCVNHRDINLMHVHDYKSAFYAWLARRKIIAPLVVTSHGQFADSRAVRLYNRIEIALMRRADIVCIVAESMRSLLVSSGIAPDRIRLIPNGIDIDRFTPGDASDVRTELGIAPGELVFGTAMRLTEVKNPLGLVEAFALRVARNPAPARLVVAGDGPLREAVHSRVEQLGLGSQVLLLGARTDLERLYRCFDAFVLPSHSEGLPLALLEAMACGVQVVASAVGEIPTVLDGLPASLVPPGDARSLSEALCSVTVNQQIGQQMRDRIVERYSSLSMAQRYAEIYRQLLEENPAHTMHAH